MNQHERLEMCYWSGRWVDVAVLKPIELEVKGLFGLSKQRDTVTVLPTHEAKLRGFFAFVSRYSTVFVGLMMLNIALALFVPAYRLWGLPTIGALIVAFPFTTNVAPAIGVRRSIVAARVVGVVMAGFGLLRLLG